MMAPLGPRLRYIRRATGYTQAQLAEALGISRRRYGFLECGRTAVPVEVVYAIANLLDVSMDDLCGRVRKEVS